MSASSVVVTAKSRGRVKRHRVVVQRMVVQMVVGAAVPTEAVVGHMVRTVVAVRSVDVAQTIVAEAVMVAAIAVAEVASVVDTGGEVVRCVATVEMTPRRYVVAFVAVAVLGLVEVAPFVLLTMQHHTLSIAYVYIVQRKL